MAAYGSDFLVGDDLDFLTDYEEEDLLLEPGEWEIGDQRTGTEVCLCNIPSTEDMILCSGKCAKWFHRKCVVEIDAGGRGHEPQMEAEGSGAAAAAASADNSAGADSSSGTREAVAGHELSSSWMCTRCLKDARSTSKGGKQRVQVPLPGSEKIGKPKKKKAVQTSVDTQSIVVSAPTIVKDVLQSILTDDIYSGSDVAALASRINYEEDSFVQFSKEICHNVISCVGAGDGHTVGPSANVEICNSFHEYRCGSGVQVQWNKFLDEQNVTASNRLVKATLLQYVLRKVLASVISLRNKKPVEEEETELMTKEEEGVLRLIAGYIPFALVKRYRKLKSSSGLKFKNTMLNWRAKNDGKTDADAFLSYTSVWITHQNRGGLFEVNDKVYRFVRSVEIVSRKELKIQKLIGKVDTAKQVLEHAIHKSETVHRCWEAVICEEGLSQRESEDLFSTVVNYYIVIRLRNFVRLYVNMKKRENSLLSRKGEKGLRKELRKKSASHT